MASSQVSNFRSLPLPAEPPQSLQGAEEVLLQSLLIGAGAWGCRASQRRIVTSKCVMEPARPPRSHGLIQLYSPGRSFLLTVTRPTFWPEKRSSSSPEKL